MIIVFRGSAGVPNIRSHDGYATLDMAIDAAKCIAENLSDKYWHCAVYDEDTEELIADFGFGKVLIWSSVKR